MASEIQLTSQEGSEISLVLSDSPSSIDVNFQEGSTINSTISESSIISTTVVPNLSQIAVVSQYNTGPVLSVRIRGDDSGPQTGDVVLEANTIPHFHPDTFYKAGDVVIYNSKIYEAKEDFTSGPIFNENDWVAISSDLQITSLDESVDITKDGNTVDLSVSRIVGEEKVRAEQVEAELRDLIEDLEKEIVQSDWNEQDSSKNDFIKNKPTKLSDFQNDENFVKSNEVYKKNEVNLQNTIITCDDASIKTYDIFTLAS